MTDGVHVAYFVVCLVHDEVCSGRVGWMNRPLGLGVELQGAGLDLEGGKSG